MRKLLVLFSLCLVGLLAMASGPLARADSVIFFDDFTAQGLSANWSFAYASMQNQVVESNSYMGMWVPSSLLSNSNNFGDVGISANSTFPIIGPNSPDGQQIFIAWKLLPFNLSFTGAAQAANLQMIGWLAMGLSGATGGTPAANGIYMIAGIASSTSSFSGFANAPPAHSWVDLAIAKPNTGAGCSVGENLFTSFGPGAICSQSGLMYTTPSAPIDLLTQHTFMLWMKFYPVTHTSWVAMAVDNMAWMNITQQECSCIDGTQANYYNLVPTLSLAWAKPTSGETTLSPIGSLGTFVDYVWIGDYNPGYHSLPAGSPLTCATVGYCPANPGLLQGVEPGARVAGGGFGNNNYSFDFKNMILFQAYDLGKGNLALGGMLMTVLELMFVFSVLGLGLKIRHTFFYASAAFGFVGVNTFLGVLPVWVAMVTVAITLILMFGVSIGGHRLESGSVLDE